MGEALNRFHGVIWHLSLLSLAYESSGARLLIKRFGTLPFSPELGLSTARGWRIADVKKAAEWQLDCVSLERSSPQF